MTGFSEPADIIDAFAAALNAKDAERLGDLFSEDAQFVNVRGVLMHGRHGIVQGHKVSFAGPLAGSVFQFDSVDQSLITPDVAVLQAHCLRVQLVARRGPHGWRAVAAANVPVLPTGGAS
jgi:uncharacterized protein (TIGR02246 family)